MLKQWYFHYTEINTASQKMSSIISTIIFLKKCIVLCHQRSSNVTFWNRYATETKPNKFSSCKTIRRNGKKKHFAYPGIISGVICRLVFTHVKILRDDPSNSAKKEKCFQVAAEKIRQEYKAGKNKCTTRDIIGVGHVTDQRLLAAFHGVRFYNLTSFITLAGKDSFLVQLWWIVK